MFYIAVRKNYCTTSTSRFRDIRSFLHVSLIYHVSITFYLYFILDNERSLLILCQPFQICILTINKAHDRTQWIWKG